MDVALLRFYYSFWYVLLSTTHNMLFIKPETNSEQLNITTTHKIKMFYNTWCLLSNLRANQLFDVATVTGVSHHALGHTVGRKPSVAPCSQIWGCFAFMRLLLTTCAWRQGKSGSTRTQNLTRMHCAPIAGDRFCTGVAHLGRTYCVTAILLDVRRKYMFLTKFTFHG